MLVKNMNINSLEKMIVKYQWDPEYIIPLISTPSERKETQTLMTLKVCDKFFKTDKRSYKLALYAANMLTKEFPSIGNDFFAALVYEKTENFTDSVNLYQSCENRISESALCFAITAMRFRALYKQTNKKEFLKEAICNFQNAINMEKSERIDVWKNAKYELEKISKKDNGL